MENQFQVFESEEFGKLRTVLINGEPYFAGKDVALSLEYKDTDQAIRVNVDERDKIVLKQKDLERMASESKPVQNTGLKIESPRGLIFINISGLFSLILSSKLPKAKEYRYWVTSKVLPSIHSKGYYILPNAEKIVEAQSPQLPKYHEIIEDVDKTAKQLEKCLGVNYYIGFATMTSIMEENYNLNLTRIKELIPPAEHEIGYLTPTQIGKEIGKSSQYVNKKLLELDLQEKDGHGGYILTEKGKEYGEAMPFERNGHAGYQIKWTFEVAEFFNKEI